MSTMYKYLPHTPEDIELMLRKVGAATLDDLFTQVPKELRLQGDYDLPPAQSEMEIRQTFKQLCARNKPLTVFAGAGPVSDAAESYVSPLKMLA